MNLLLSSFIIFVPPLSSFVIHFSMNWKRIDFSFSHSSRGNKTIMTKCCFQVLCGKCYSRLTDSTGSFGAWPFPALENGLICKDEILEVLEEPAQLHFYIWYDLIWFYIWQHCNMHATWQNNSSDRAFFMPLLPWCWWFRARRHRGTGGKKNTPLQFL